VIPSLRCSLWTPHKLAAFFLGPGAQFGKSCLQPTDAGVVYACGDLTASACSGLAAAAGLLIAQRAWLSHSAWMRGTPTSSGPPPPGPRSREAAPALAPEGFLTPDGGATVRPAAGATERLQQVQACPAAQPRRRHGTRAVLDMVALLDRIDALLTGGAAQCKYCHRWPAWKSAKKGNGEVRQWRSHVGAWGGGLLCGG
jgi:hypothetical protein